MAGSEVDAAKVANPFLPWQCQKDSYKKEFKTVFLSCKPAEFKTPVDGKPKKVKGYEVVLQDTILFPEGGGQPDDRGLIGGVEVLCVRRNGPTVLHYTEKPIEVEPEAEVDVKVDWNRRFDHMQQHTGQHLISAECERMFGWPTTSWNLGNETSTIELDTDKMSPEQVAELEKVCNERIRDQINVTPIVYSKDDPEVATFHTLGLPADHVGPVRLLDIKDVAQNLCCGTHVNNLAHLQIIKLLGAEKAKKGKVNLGFVVGDRVANYLHRCVENERALTALLKAAPREHVSLATKSVNGFRTAQKSITTLLRELATHEARVFREKPKTQPVDRLLEIHQRDAANDFMMEVVSQVADPEAVLFLTSGDDKGAGLFLIVAPEKCLQETSQEILELIEGKGAVKKGRMQGKANRLQKKSKAVEVLKDWLIKDAAGDDVKESKETEQATANEQ